MSNEKNKANLRIVSSNPNYMKNRIKKTEEDFQEGINTKIKMVSDLGADAMDVFTDDELSEILFRNEDSFRGKSVNTDQLNKHNKLVEMAKVLKKNYSEVRHYSVSNPDSSKPNADVALDLDSVVGFFGRDLKVLTIMVSLADDVGMCEIDDGIRLTFGTVGVWQE